jgi:hypothetical protein
MQRKKIFNDLMLKQCKTNKKGERWPFVNRNATDRHERNKHRLLTPNPKILQSQNRKI